MTSIEWYEKSKELVQTTRGLDILKEWEDICKSYSLLSEVTEFMQDNSASINSEADFLYYMDRGMYDWDL